MGFDDAVQQEQEYRLPSPTPMPAPALNALCEDAMAKPEFQFALQRGGPCVCAPVAVLPIGGCSNVRCSVLFCCALPCRVVAHIGVYVWCGWCTYICTMYIVDGENARKTQHHTTPHQRQFTIVTLLGIRVGVGAIQDASFPSSPPELHPVLHRVASHPSPCPTSRCASTGSWF
ncbi:hypothetical protein COCVIDRAFT_41486 [Bipolaris victoriae FI3]|uniref:Uncharacterized protein n=1 Tax=Bipolaris victoriae (strain FI3) TaxID=930091 RepID=W7E6S4_BIPV3|nr:hypothetical protein COCVIDRAFT_41486 [Bipolaris victoriae FI3]